MCWWRRKLTYPEEPPTNATIENADVPGVLTDWLIAWKVQESNWEYWRNQIVVTLRNDIPYPAGAYDGPDSKRHIDIQPQYLVPGVIAHEQAHNSYALLSEQEKIDFADIHGKEKNKGLVKHLYSINSYGLSSDIEGHAEVYRFLGHKMPKNLKIFYPKLF